MKRHGVTVERLPTTALAHATPPLALPAALGTPPDRNSRAKPHITAAECFALSLAMLAARNVIDRALLETIFDEAEQQSLLGETPTQATATVRILWDIIESRTPE